MPDELDNDAEIKTLMVMVFQNSRILIKTVTAIADAEMILILRILTMTEFLTLKIQMMTMMEFLTLKIQIFNKNNPKDNDDDDSDNPYDYSNPKDNDNDDTDNPSNNIDLSGTNAILSVIEDNTDGIEGELNILMLILTGHLLN